MEGFARRSRESRPTDTKDPCSKTKDDDSEGRGGEKYLVDDTRFHEKVGTTSLSLSLSLSLRHRGRRDERRVFVPETTGIPPAAWNPAMLNEPCARKYNVL